jgi:hypothetical protein
MPFEGAHSPTLRSAFVDDDFAGSFCVLQQHPLRASSHVKGHEKSRQVVLSAV